MKKQVYIFPKTNKSSKNIKYDNQASEILKDIVKPHYDDDGILVVGLLDFLMQTEWSVWVTFGRKHGGKNVELIVLNLLSDIF